MTIFRLQLNMERSTKFVLALALLLATFAVSNAARELKSAEPDPEKYQPQTFPGFPGGPPLGSGSGSIPGMGLGFGLGQPAFGYGMGVPGLGSTPTIPGFPGTIPGFPGIGGDDKVAAKP